MSEEDNVQQDRNAAKERGRDKPRTIGALMQQVLDSAGMTHVDIPRYSTPQELMQAREQFMDKAPPQRPTSVPEPTVPRKFVDVRFASSVDRPEVAHYELALERSRQWAEMAAHGKAANLALIGPKGTSKSHLAYCAAWHLHEEYNVYASCFNWLKIAPELRWNTDDGYTLRRRLTEVPVLIMDEARPTSGTDFDAMELARISMVRYDDELPTFVTCNWESLEEVMGEPAADRFTQVVLQGPSFRERGT